MISCTPKAAAKLRCKLLKDTPDVPRPGVRIGIRPTGCSGLSYALEMCDLDTLTDADEMFESEGVTLVVAKKNQPFLAGTRLDFVRDGLNEKLTFENPNEVGRCGCGESFKV